MDRWMVRSGFRCRSQLADLCNSLGLKGHVVEIGVHRGVFSRQFLDKWHGEHFHAVDPWSNPPGYQDPIAASGHDRNDDYFEFLANTEPHAHRVHTHRMLSMEAVELFAPDSLDMVYVDADHSKPMVVKDIEAYYRLVKPGGIVAGHDIVNGPFMQVREAVYSEIVEKRGYHAVQVIPGDAWSWFVVKGQK